MSMITTPEQLRDRLEASPDKLMLYHGTGCVFHEFEARTLNRDDDGVPSDGNSDFGVHLTASPHYAYEFAEFTFSENGVVLIVEADLSKLYVVDSRDQYLDLTPEQYAEWRERLIADGYEGVVADDIGEDLREACVIFDPAKLRIVGHLPASIGWDTFAEIEDLRDGTDSKWPGIKMSYSKSAAAPEFEPTFAP